MARETDAVPDAQPYRFRAMGTDVEVIVVDGPEGAAEGAEARIEDLEARWSRFRPDSELSRLNRAGGTPAVVSLPTFRLVQRAIEAWTLTEHRFDPSVLPALEAAGYDRSFDEMPAEVPGPSRSTGAAPGCAGIRLDPVVRAVTLPPGVRLDLGGIGKGYAADLVVSELRDQGAAGACVNLGGDLHVWGVPPDGASSWVVAIEDPAGRHELGNLALAAGGVATSTRLRRAWRRDGQPSHHLLDPATGEPAFEGLASVTVLAAETWWAEVLAKAAFVAGPKAGWALLARHGVTGLFVLDDDRVVALPGLADFRVADEHVDD
jgi:thiamine biosynthesis lipoprotein